MTNAFGTLGQEVLGQGTAYLGVVGSGRVGVSRILGCMMLVSMPEDALREAIVSLNDIVVFYRDNPTFTASLAMPTRSKSLQASLGVKRERPELVLQEDQ